MAQKLLRAKKSKIAPKKDAGADMGAVLVGTYKEKQLAWIRKRRLYNYPLSEDEVKAGAEDWDKVKELWLYSGSKDLRHIYEAGFVGIKSRKDFLQENPD